MVEYRENGSILVEFTHFRGNECFLVKWVLLGPKTALGGKWDPEPSIYYWFMGYFERGGAKGRFCAESHLFCEKAPKWWDSTIFMKMSGI